MMSRILKSIISDYRRTFFTLCVLAAALLLSGTTFAWISANYDVYHENDQMQIDGDTIGAVRFTAYSYDNTSNTADVVEGEDIVLPLYDSVFKEQNKNSCLIFKAPVFGSAISAGDAFRISLDLEDRSDVTGISDNNLRDSRTFEEGTTDPAIADLVSNAVYIRCGVIDSLQNDTSDAETVFTTAHNFFATPSNCEEHKFLTISGDDLLKSDEISFTVSDYSPANILYVYLEIGYDPDLVDIMLQSRGLSLSGEELGNGSTIVIDSDLNEFTFYTAS